jgi:hypothetical protein
MLNRPDSLEEFQRKQREKETAKADGKKPEQTKPEQTKPEQKTESRAVTETREAHIKKGQEAWTRLQDKEKEKATYYDWQAVIDALAIGRTECMIAAETNDPRGGRYNRLFKAWLDKHGFAGIDGGDRKKCFDCLQYRSDIDKWYWALPQNKRLKLNHPATIWRAWPHKPKRAAKPAKPEGEEKPTNLKAAIHMIDEQAARIKELEEERDGAREANGGGEPLNVDKLLDALVELLQDKPESERVDLLNKLSKKLKVTATKSTKPKPTKSKSKKSK